MPIDKCPCDWLYANFPRPSSQRILVKSFSLDSARCFSCAWFFTRLRIPAFSGSLGGRCGDSDAGVSSIPENLKHEPKLPAHQESIRVRKCQPPGMGKLSNVTRPDFVLRDFRENLEDANEKVLFGSR